MCLGERRAPAGGIDNCIIADVKERKGSMAEDWQKIGSNKEEILIYLGLLVFGTGYNVLVSRLEERRKEEAIVSLLVVVGVAVTVLSVWPLIGRRRVAVLLRAFVASGTPMIAGSLSRYMERDRRGASLHAGAFGTEG